MHATVDSDQPRASSDREIIEYFTSQATGVRNQAEKSKFSRFFFGLCAIPFLLLAYAALFSSMKPSDENYWMASFAKEHPVIAILFGVAASFTVGYGVAEGLNEVRARRAERRAFELEWKAAVLKNLTAVNEKNSEQR